MNANNLVVENYLIFQRPKVGLCMTFPVSLWYSSVPLPLVLCCSEKDDRRDVY